MIKQHRRLATALVGGLALLTLAACGSNTASGGANPPAGNASGGPGGAGTGRGGTGAGAGFPGVSGLIVALSGTTAQVRTTAGQSAVSFTDKTTVTEQQKAAVSDVKAGLCATVRSASTASGQATPSTTVTASTVALSDEVGGSCRGGFGGGFGGGARPQGAPSGAAGGAGGAPSGLPSGAMPSGARGGGFGGANGKITAVSGTTMTVQETRGTQQTAVTVNLTGDTTYTRQAKTDTKAITTGKCILATGKTDSTGALAATAVRLSAPVNGECGFGGGRRNASGSQSGG